MEKHREVSQKTIDAGKKFVESIKSGKIRQDLPPININEKPYNDQEDFEPFLEFTKTEFYKKLLEQE